MSLVSQAYCTIWCLVCQRRQQLVGDIVKTYPLDDYELCVARGGITKILENFHSVGFAVVMENRATEKDRGILDGLGREEILDLQLHRATDQSSR